MSINSHFNILSWTLLGREPNPSPNHTREALAVEVRLFWEDSNEIIVDACCAIVTESPSSADLVALLTVPSPGTAFLEVSVLPNVGTPSNVVFPGTTPIDTAEEKITQS